MNDIIDISIDIDEKLVVWPKNKKVEFFFEKNIENGDKSNDSGLKMGVHTGTHIDAPHHFLNNGVTVDQIDLHSMIGEVFVASFQDAVEISAKDLDTAGIPTSCERLLLKTNNSIRFERDREHFFYDYCALSQDGAEWIRDRSLRLVGIDYLSIEAFGNTAVHEILLTSGIVILEAITLQKVEQGWYTLFCLPIKLKSLEAAPVRAVLLKKIWNKPLLH